jgi:hypothetical protein
MREIRQSGSEGGGPQPNAASLPLFLIERVRERPGMLASPSPSSRWGQFPIFTGVKVFHRATPTKVAPLRGITRRA